ncbi:MAG: endonuclease/exonuclease/phosphatase family protein [Bauldia sp.]|nr:endonuclease/exonuclease/phosphatase family protein [Bauldia sp.]
MPILKALLAVLGLAPAVALIAAEWFWPGDLLVFFLPWLAFGAYALFAAMLVLGWRLPAATAAVLLIVCAGLVGSAWRTPPAGEPAGRPFRVTTFNTLVGNAHPETIGTFLRAELPDVVALQETFGPFKEAVVASLRDVYPYSSAGTAVEESDIEILSRHPIMELTFAATERVGRTAYRVMRAVLDVDDMRVAFYAVHAPTPRFGAADWEARNRILADVGVAARRDALMMPVIVAGDFNTPSWSPHLRRLLDTGNLTDTSGRLLPSATRLVDREGLPLSFGAPVDHILVSSDVHWTPVRLGPALGSDHLPVTADLVLASPLR